MALLYFRPASMTNGSPTTKRIFSYEDAVALLPEVRNRTQHAYREVEALASSPEANTREALQGRLEQIVKDWAAGLAERGLEVKGLWLVDFDNGSGYYCWQYPEEGLQYYHSYEEGFGGRMRIH